MDLDEVQKHIGDVVIKDHEVPVLIKRVIMPGWLGYEGLPRVRVRLVGFSSETDVAPEQLTMVAER